MRSISIMGLLVISGTALLLSGCKILSGDRHSDPGSFLSTTNPEPTSSVTPTPTETASPPASPTETATPIADTYSVGGTISGLSGTLVLQNNGGDNLSETTNGSFNFATKVADGSPYAVTVLTQPSGQTCLVTSGSGTMGAADVAGIAVSCSSTYTVGGTISGLTGTVILKNNGGDSLSLSSTGGFTFATGLSGGATFAVTVGTQPSGQSCVITNGSGTVASSNITNVGITCAADTALWAVTPTTAPNTSFFNSVAMDSFGNTYAAGQITGTGTFGFGNSVTAAGAAASNNAVIVKYNSYGVAQWAKTQTGATAPSVFSGVAVDPAGNAYAVGYASGTTAHNFGNGKTVSGPDAGNNLVIVKYDTNGLAQWAKSLTSGAAASLFSGVTVDSGGNAFAVGSLTNNGSYGFGNSITAQGARGNNESNLVIVKYDTNGLAQWAQSTSTAASYSVFNRVAVDTGGVYAVGYIAGVSSYGFGNSVTAAGPGAQNAVIVKYDTTTGLAQWAQSTTCGLSRNSMFYGVAVDSTGNPYAVGTISGTTQIGFGNSVTATGPAAGTNAVMVKYDKTAGAAQWATTTVSGPATAFNGAVAVDSSGNAYAVGYLSNNTAVSFGNSVTASGAWTAANAFIEKINSSGTPQWVQTTTSATGTSYFTGVTLDSAGGNACAAGYLGTGSAYGFGGSVSATGVYSGSNAIMVNYAF